MSALIPKVADLLPPPTPQEDIFRKRDLVFGVLYPVVSVVFLYLAVPLYVEAISDVAANAWNGNFRSAFIGVFLIVFSLAPLGTAFSMARRAVKQALHRYRGVFARGIVADFEKVTEVTYRNDDNARKQKLIDWRLEVELADAPFAGKRVDVFRRTGESFSPTVGDYVEVLIDSSGPSPAAYGDMRDYRESYSIGLIFYLGLCGLVLGLVAVAAN